MFGIGLPELILIMALALIVVGPDKLPDLAKSIAKQILELKKTANSLKDSLQEELHGEEQERKRTPSMSMEEQPLLETHDSADNNSHYPSLKEDIAVDLTPVDPENFNASSEAAPTGNELDAENTEKDSRGRDAGEKS